MKSWKNQKKPCDKSRFNYNQRMDKEQYIKRAWDSTRYYSDEAMTVLHREDGPAVEAFGGHEEWFIDGLRKNEDGTPYSDTTSK